MKFVAIIFSLFVLFGLDFTFAFAQTSPTITEASISSDLSVLTLAGLNLSGVTTVDFIKGDCPQRVGSVPNWSNVTATSITMNLPFQVTDALRACLVNFRGSTMSISVGNANGLLSNMYNLPVPAAPMPAISYISPMTVVAGGSVTIHGTNLYGSVPVFGGSLLSINVTTDSDPLGSYLTFTIPVTAPAGSHTIQLAQRIEGGRSNSVSIIVTPLIGSLSASVPSVNLLSQQGKSPAATAMTLVNNGTAPTNITISIPNQPGWLNVTYNQYQTLNPGGWTQLTIMADVMRVSQSGTYSANIVVSGNFANSPLTIPVTLVAQTPQPSIAYINPSSASIGSTVTIHGTNLYGDSVFFDGVPLPSGETIYTYPDGSGGSMTFTIPLTTKVGIHTLQVEHKTVVGRSNSVALNIITATPTLDFTASPSVLSTGQSSYLKWSSTGATSCISSGDGASWGWPSIRYILGGQHTANFTTLPQTFTITCTGPGGSISKSVTVTSASASTPPSSTITGTPARISLGQSSSLTWTSANATYCTFNDNMVRLGGTYTVATAGSISSQPLTFLPHQFILACMGDFGNSISKFTVTDINQAPKSCTDTDGGLNPNVAGFVDGREWSTAGVRVGNTFDDKSVTSNGGICDGMTCTAVAEGYCENGEVHNKLTLCPSGYSRGGICLAAPVNAGAQANTSQNPSIDELMLRIKALQGQLGTNATPSSPIVSPSSERSQCKLSNLSPPVYSYGAQGRYIKELQVILQNLGYIDEGVQVTGYHGSLTRTAVIRFQKVHKLPAEGYIGALTLSAVEGACVGVPAKNIVAKTVVPSASVCIVRDLNPSSYAYGEQNASLKELQRILQKFGFLDASISVTGYHGSATRNAVSAFQRKSALPDSGYIGAMTLAAINKKCANTP